MIERKGATNLLTGRVLGGFFPTMVFTGMLFGMASSDESPNYGPFDSAGAVAVFFVVLIFAGPLVSAGTVAALGFWGTRRWETAVVLLMGMAIGSWAGVMAGLTLAHPAVRTSEEKHRILMEWGAGTGAFFGAINGAFFTLGVRRLMVRLTGESENRP